MVIMSHVCHAGKNLISTTLLYFSWPTLYWSAKISPHPFVSHLYFLFPHGLFKPAECFPLETALLCLHALLDPSIHFPWMTNKIITIIVVVIVLAIGIITIIGHLVGPLHIFSLKLTLQSRSFHTSNFCYFTEGLQVGHYLCDFMFSKHSLP